MSEVIQGDMPLQEDFIREVAIELTELILFLHSSASVTNIDLRPNQILITPEGRVKMRSIVVPRGKFDLYDDIKYHSTVFIAPEVYNDGVIDERTDMYSIGYLLYSLITRKDFSKPPYVVLPLHNACPDLSAALEQIVLKCIEPNPKDRYQSAKALLKDLKNIDKLNHKLRKTPWYKHLFS